MAKDTSILYNAVRKTTPIHSSRALKRRLNPNELEEISYSFKNGDIKIEELDENTLLSLLENCPDVDVNSRFYFSPESSSSEELNFNYLILAACSKGYARCVKYLLDRGAKGSYFISDEYSNADALYAAAGCGWLDIVCILLDHMQILLPDNTTDTGSTTDIINNAFVQACSRGHIEIVKHFLQTQSQNVNINTYESTPIVVACSATQK